MLQDENGIELAPCIVSRAKCHLGIPNRYTFNDKPCSNNYWNRTIDVLISLHYVSERRVRRVRRMKDNFDCKPKTKTTKPKSTDKGMSEVRKWKRSQGL